MTLPSRELLIRNRLGLHARAAAKLVQAASRFKSKVTVLKGTEEVDAKSILGILLLAAAQGTTIQVTAVGDDAEEALDAIENLIESRFDEGE
jgi:phosphotransferase system HPr (HPr) family protein